MECSNNSIKIIEIHQKKKRCNGEKGKDSPHHGLTLAFTKSHYPQTELGFGLHTHSGRLGSPRTYGCGAPLNYPTISQWQGCGAPLNYPHPHSGRLWSTPELPTAVEHP